MTDAADRLKLANQMLSLVGSIQPDPFSPAHVPVAAVVDAPVAAVEQAMDLDPPAPDVQKKKDKKTKKRKAADEEATQQAAEEDAPAEGVGKKKRKKKDKL